MPKSSDNVAFEKVPDRNFIAQMKTGTGKRRRIVTGHVIQIT